MRLRLLWLGLLLAIGCKGSVDDGYAFDLTVVVDATVPDEALARISGLRLEVSGDETYSTLITTNHRSRRPTAPTANSGAW